MTAEIRTNTPEIKERLPQVTSYEVLHGPEAFLADLEEEIDRAKASVDLQFYVYEGDIVGNRVSDRVKAAARRGVKGRLMVDHFTDMSHSDHYVHVPRINRNLQRTIREELAATHAMFNAMRQEGVGVKMICPPGVLYQQVLFRDHKKMVIIDGNTPEDAIAYLGGFNICDHEYPWNTFMVKMRGEGVEHLQNEYNDAWEGKSTGKVIPIRRGKVLVDAKGGSHITPAAVGAIYGAENRIVIESPYVWGKEVYDALQNRARAGVPTTLIIPEHNNKKLFVPTSRTIDTCKQNGIEVYAYQAGDGMTHSKVLQTDKTVSFGTFNFNCFTAGKVGEVNISSFDASLVSQVEAMLAKDLASSVRL